MRPEAEKSGTDGDEDGDGDGDGGCGEGDTAGRRYRRSINRDENNDERAFRAPFAEGRSEPQASLRTPDGPPGNCKCATGNLHLLQSLAERVH